MTRKHCAALLVYIWLAAPARCPYLPFHAASSRWQSVVIRLSYGFSGAVASTIFVQLCTVTNFKNRTTPAWAPHRGRALIVRTTQDFRWPFVRKNLTMIVGSWNNRTAPAQLSQGCRMVPVQCTYNHKDMRQSHYNRTMTVQPPCDG